MPVSGRKPKPEGQSRNRSKPTHDWTEVDGTPYDGTPPVELPDTRSELTRDGQVVTLPLHERTRSWWTTVSTMPHCRLWTRSDWEFALTTAVAVVDPLSYGKTSLAGELRQREKVLGTTVDARRDLRIKYVDPQPEKEMDSAEVTRLDDYRDL